MAQIRSKNTKPELLVRSMVHAAGFRYRLHQRSLAGCPDLVFPSKRKAIFVHGCFWHRHQKPRCKLARMPKSRIEFWRNKLEANKERDKKNVLLLENDGWRVLIIWECELDDHAKLRRKVVRFLK
jgi:DNA mismatch endonuclease (patch repair protein)